MTMRLLMLGTGGFALPTFRALVESQHEVAGLFTQPDRKGAGHHDHANPLKELALERGIPVFQPANINLPDSLDQLRGLRPDLCVVAAYGQILSADMLGIPRLGAINVHASLLPKYRGASPIQTAILKGESETGITIFQIEPKLDAGPMLAIESTPIGRKETSGMLETRLAEIGARLARAIVDQIDRGATTPIVQDSMHVSRARRLKKEDGLIDWSRPAREIDWQVRALQPWPLAYTFLHQAGKPTLRLILLDVEPIAVAGDGSPGRVIVADRRQLVVNTGDGALQILRLKTDGKRDMTASEFLNGRPISSGDRLGGPEPPA